jgi:hypothetical protein
VTNLRLYNIIYQFTTDVQEGIYTKYTFTL